MNTVNFPPEYETLGANGQCPHCSVLSFFEPVATHLSHLSYLPSPTNKYAQTGVSACRCASCKKFVLVVGYRMLTMGTAKEPFSRADVYPLGKPNDAIDANIPKDIGADFQEALRCEWIKAFKACVVMCARAIQGSAMQLGAKTKRLVDQIDELFAQGKITEALKDFAHEVRVTRNLGAHPDKDGLEDVAEKDANDIVEFTREYLHHVYVMPAKLKARKPAPPPAQPSTNP